MYVKDFTYKDRFVRALFPGMFFGEISILTYQNRTATVKSKNYSTLGSCEHQKFIDYLVNFPDIKKSIMSSLQLYQDHYKNWNKFLLSNVNFLRELRFDVME